MANLGLTEWNINEGEPQETKELGVVIPEFGKGRQEKGKFQASLTYRTRPCLKQANKL
jgi:hypothetical protein